MRPWILLPLFALTLPSTGCLSAVYDEPEFESGDVPDDVYEDEDEQMELPPQPLPLEVSPTSLGMLRVANELSAEQLDLDVGLDQRAAQSIIEYRAGADARLGTGDDRYVESLERLDSLYWLGEANLWILQQYALREGYVMDALPQAECDPVLADAIDDCLRFIEQAADDSAPAEHRVPSCMTQSEPTCPSSEFFASAGVTDYGDPMLGYHALLCGGGQPPALCDLGVAGLSIHLVPHCDERFDADG